jgi:hypothetical protein
LLGVERDRLNDMIGDQKNYGTKYVSKCKSSF